MPGITCPQCGLFNPDSADGCDCGYNFKTKTVPRASELSRLTANSAGATSRTTRAGAVLLCFGVAILLTVSVARPTTPAVLRRATTLVPSFPAGLLFPVLARSFQSSMAPVMAAGVGWLLYAMVGTAIVVVNRKGVRTALFVLFVAMLVWNTFVMIAIQALGALR